MRIRIIFAFLHFFCDIKEYFAAYTASSVFFIVFLDVFFLYIISLIGVVASPEDRAKYT
jgi:hypothetical protein